MAFKWYKKRGRRSRKSIKKKILRKARRLMRIGYRM